MTISFKEIKEAVEEVFQRKDERPMSIHSPEMEEKIQEGVVEQLQKMKIDGVRKLSITKAREATERLRNYLVEAKGISYEEAKAQTKNYYKTYRRAYYAGYLDAQEV